MGKNPDRHLILAAQAEVVECIRSYGPLHDEELVRLLHENGSTQPAGDIRTRRIEVARKGLIVSTGLARTRTSGLTRTWSTVDKVVDNFVDNYPDRGPETGQNT